MKKHSFIQGFNYAVDGIIHTLISQRNMRIHYFIAIIILFFSLFFNISRMEMIAVFFAITLVIMAEMFNTAVEKTIDLVTMDYNHLAKIAKDVSAGAVLVAGFNALFVGYLIFFDRLNPITLQTFQKIRNQGIHITLIGIILVIVLVITGKSLSFKGSHFQGGMISGHAAVSSALATAIAFISENTLVATLSFVMALLVAQSRIEGKIHTLREVILGGLLGILVMTFLFKILFG